MPCTAWPKKKWGGNDKSTVCIVQSICVKKKIKIGCICLGNCWEDSLEVIVRIFDYVCVLLYLKNIYILNIYFYLSVYAGSTSIVRCGIFSCNMEALSCSIWDLVPWLGIEPECPALGTWSLNHSANQGSPKASLHFNKQLNKSLS